MKQFRLLIIIMLLGVVIGAAVYGWTGLYTRYLETASPDITFSDGQPRGIGLTPIKVHLDLSDWGAGLDEIVARIHQRSLTKEVLRQSLKGQPKTVVSFELDGEKLGLDEGLMTLEVKVFDRSFWSNSAQRSLDLRVDYRRPRLEMISAMHNVRQGGAQLLLYKAIDEGLAVSGVKVGAHTFIGFPAVGLDPEFEDRSIFATVFSIPLSEGDNPTVRLFAQDTVGNGSSTTFPYRILPRSSRTVPVKVGEDLLRGPVSQLADRSFPRLEQMARASGQPFGYRSPAGSDGQLFEKLQLVVDKLIPLSIEDLKAPLSRSARLERAWDTSMIQPNAVVLAGYGDTLSYRGDWVDAPSAVQSGFEFQMSRADSAVLSASGGTVLFLGDVGTYGKVIVIDHGLGLATTYGRLDSINVREGQQVVMGERIGTAGRSGFARTHGFFFEVRVQGIPSDPREWWDRGWFAAHVAEKIDSAKKTLGLMRVPALE